VKPSTLGMRNSARACGKSHPSFVLTVEGPNPSLRRKLLLHAWSVRNDRVVQDLKCYIWCDYFWNFGGLCQTNVNMSCALLVLLSSSQFEYI